MNRWVAAISCVLLAACAASHGRHADGGSTGGTDGGRDGAPPAGTCTSPRGAEICDTPECPFEDDEESCAACLGWPDQPGGFCAIEPLEGCAYSGGCLHGLCVTNPEGRLEGGLCASAAACHELHDRGDPLICRYVDGTAFATGLLRSESCPAGFEGVACGPACAPCASGEHCLGPSEQSGLGVCYLPGSNPTRDHRCSLRGESHDPRCADPADACLVLRAERDEAWDYDIWGFCMEPTVCEALAAARPDRFECHSPE